MHNRRKFLLQTGMAATAILAARPFSSIASANRQFFPSLEGTNNLTILHTNDIFNSLGPVDSGLGGFYRTAEMIRAIKEKNQHLVLLDAGNTFSGKTRHLDAHDETLALMNSLGYDAMLPGDRDLGAGPAYLNEKISRYDLPVVASNLSIHDSGLNASIRSYKIIKKGTLRIGIIGAASNKNWMNTKTGYANPVKEMNRIANMLKKEKNCDLVICLSQLGFTNRKAIDDIGLARQSRDIDIIIGGYSRTFMQQPRIVLNKNRHEVIINHAAYSGIVLGNLEIGFDDQKRKNRVSFNNILVGSVDQKWQIVA